MFSLVDRAIFPTTILRMNIEQIEQTCADLLLQFTHNMADYYVKEPEDYSAAVTALLVRTLEIHLNREIDIKKVLDKR